MSDGQFLAVDISPDGNKSLLLNPTSANNNIWVIDNNSLAKSKLTFLPGAHSNVHFINNSESVKIHGLTFDDIDKSGIDLELIIDELVEDFNNVNFIIGHNINFDIKILVQELKLYKTNVNNQIDSFKKLFEKLSIISTIDTLKQSKTILGKIYSLSDIFEYYFKKKFNSHNALNDTLATMFIFLKLNNIIISDSFNIILNDLFISDSEKNQIPLIEYNIRNEISHYYRIKKFETQKQLENFIKDLDKKDKYYKNIIINNNKDYSNIVSNMNIKIPKKHKITKLNFTFVFSDDFIELAVKTKNQSIWKNTLSFVSEKIDNINNNLSDNELMILFSEKEKTNIRIIIIKENKKIDYKFYVFNHESTKFLTIFKLSKYIVINSYIEENLFENQKSSTFINHLLDISLI